METPVEWSLAILVVLFAALLSQPVLSTEFCILTSYPASDYYKSLEEHSKSDRQLRTFAGFSLVESQYSLFPIGGDLLFMQENTKEVLVLQFM